MADGGGWSDGHQRTVLLLQGPASWFMTHLAATLRARGCRVIRVLFCPGDRLFCRGPEVVAYRGRRDAWPAFARTLMERDGVTDLVCLGAGRRIHAEALAEAGSLGVRAHGIEQGYLRPGWLTVEPLWPVGRSAFPQDAAVQASLSRRHRESVPPKYRASFANYAAMDVAWNLANQFSRLLGYRHYRSHAIHSAPVEWSGWVRKAVVAPRDHLRDVAVLHRIDGHSGRLFLFPLQLETDFQIRLHGPAGGLRPALARIVRSFARHAPADALLVVKRHPLDNGWAPWRRILIEVAAGAGVRDRVAFLTQGNLERLVEQSAGVVTVNSTVGLSALQAGRPVVTLGRAIYNQAGLTHQRSLEDFWTAPQPPDADALARFVEALKASIQVPGGFDGEGARPGAIAVADRILNPVLCP